MLLGISAVNWNGNYVNDSAQRGCYEHLTGYGSYGWCTI